MAVLYLLVHTGVAAIIMVDDMYSFIYSLAIIMVQNYIYIMPCEPMMLNQLPIVPLNDSHQPISFVTFWGAFGAPILFSDLGLRMASCSYIYIYIYIYIFLSFCKWRRSRRSLQSFKSSLMTFRRV